jgi:hypothetical protein
MAVKASATVTLSSIRDLQSCTRYYLLQSSTLSPPAKPTAKPPGGSWTTTEPSYTSGSTNSLYFCDLNVFTDGDFAYSDVSLSSSYEAAKAAYNKAQASERAAAQALSSTECIVGTQTASTNAWTGRASFASLTDGQVILYWLPYAGTSTAATLNLTLSGGGTTGAKNVYISSTTRCTTHIAAGNMVQMVYRAGVSIGGTAYTGWWISRALNDNTYDRIRFNNAIKAKTAISASRLIVSDSGGYYHLGAGLGFHVDKPILWAVSAISAAATGTNNYLSYPSCTLRNNAGSSWTATQYATLYLAGTLAGNVFTVASENWLTTAPANESLTYISLGYMYSTYQMYFYPEHPMYHIVGGVLKAVSQIAYEATVKAEDARAEADETKQTLLRVVRIDSDGLHVGDNQNTNNEVLIDSEAVNVVTGGVMESKFTGSYIQFGNYQLRRTADNGLAFKVKEG